MQPSRYHLALRSLHWVCAVLLIIGLVMGTFVLDKTPNSSPEKINALRGHMIFGVLILVLTVIRLIVRLRSTHPKPVFTGIALADRFAPLMHWGLYTLIFVIAVSGIGIAALTGLPEIVFAGDGILPTDFKDLPPRAVHGVVAKLLMLAIALHVIAALFHQFVRKDRLLSRMGFGK
ncbi:MAG: cytochrome b [Sulfuricella sp.]|nr:cytochrome b [Sulfuricella sp.]